MRVSCCSYISHAQFILTDPSYPDAPTGAAKGVGAVLEKSFGGAPKCIVNQFIIKTQHHNKYIVRKNGFQKNAQMHVSAFSPADWLLERSSA